jgi:membrane protease subunit (stomatin/prohibitin family)
MSLTDFLRKQFIDVIDWVESEPGLLAYRFPMQDREIQSGAMLTVRESQLAVFINEGKVADTFQPGLYKLTTNTLPILTYLRNWDKAFQSPFKSDVYFFTQREQLDQRWGTAQPITLRDKDYGPLRIRAYGNYSYRIRDIEPFWKRLSGTFERFTVEDLDGQLRARVMAEIAAFLGGSEVAFVDMAANQSQFSAKLKEVLAGPFAEYGLELRNFLVESVSLPEELQERLDKASSMRIVGDLRAYTQFQTAEAIPAAAANAGGIAGAGAGLGAGLAIGQAMAGQMAGQTGAPPAAPAPASTAAIAANAVNVEDPLAMLDRLHELVGKGVLTQAEFDTKKAQLLDKIR